MVMKKLLFSLGLTVISINLFAQIDFIKFIGEKPFRTKIKKVTDSSVIYQTGRGPEFTSLIKSIDFIEYGGQRVIYYNYLPADHDIYTPELQKISKERPLELMKKGGKVFIPITIKTEGNMLGNIFMRELLPDYNYWEIVNSEQEAEFILNFIYDDSGRDKVYFTLKTRDNNIFYKSTVVKAETTFSRSSQASGSVVSLLKTEMNKIWNNKIK
jgi:hypothetical protein